MNRLTDRPGQGIDTLYQIIVAAQRFALCLAIRYCPGIVKRLVMMIWWCRFDMRVVAAQSNATAQLSRPLLVKFLF